jgi:hypothetical protein
MPTFEHFQRRAEECRAMAQQTHDEHERAILLKMSAQRDRLADHRAKREAKAWVGST